jgi:hypothetical protein
MGEDDPENVWDSPESSSVDVTVYNVAPVTEEKETLTEVESITVATMSVGAARGVMVTAGEEGEDVEFVPLVTTVME